MHTAVWNKLRPTLRHAFAKDLALLAICLVFFSCGLRGRNQMIPVDEQETPLATEMVGPPVESPASRGSTPAAGPTYRITPGDRLQVRFPDLVSQDFEALVRPDGYITSPRYGDLPAMGWTPQQLADSVRAVYENEYRTARTTVQVAQFGTQYYYVFGEVGSPSRYELDTPTELVGAVTRAGGFLQSAVAGNVVLLKVGPDGGYTYSIHDLEDIMEDPELPVWLEPNDIVIVPQSAISNAAEFIRNYVMVFIAPVDAYLRGRYYWHLIANANP